jgi:predicted enzyme related to lactoylglutathione lyase
VIPQGIAADLLPPAAPTYPLGMVPLIRPGTNIAVKIPRADYAAAVAFYRDVLRLPVAPAEGYGYTSHTVAFGPNTLWLDEFPRYTRSEVWLELLTHDLPAALEHLKAHGFTTCDEVEPLPPDARAHWLRSPAGTVHLLREEASSPGGLAGGGG